jgi:hypothetical protein
MKTRYFVDGTAQAQKIVFWGPVFRDASKRESAVRCLCVVCRHDRCALRDGVVCRKARMASLRRPPAQSTALSLLSQPPVSPTALSLLSHPPLFTFSHFRRFPSRLWRTPRTLSPCTSKYSLRVTLRHLDSQCLTRISCLPRHAG